MGPLQPSLLSPAVPLQTSSSAPWHHTSAVPMQTTISQRDKDQVFIPHLLHVPHRFMGEESSGALHRGAAPLPTTKVVLHPKRAFPTLSSAALAYVRVSPARTTGQGHLPRTGAFLYGRIPGGEGGMGRRGWAGLALSVGGREAASTGTGKGIRVTAVSPLLRKAELRGLQGWTPAVPARPASSAAGTNCAAPAADLAASGCACGPAGSPRRGEPLGSVPQRPAAAHSSGAGTGAEAGTGAAPPSSPP